MKQTYKLHNGVEIPTLGFGTFPMRKFELIKALWNGVETGYTLFDTATAYRNEIEIGVALKRYSSAKQRDLFISTKISNRQQEFKDVRAALNRSLLKLGVKYVDMYMIHWPYSPYYYDTWRQIEDLYDEGKIKAIGVCNFHQHHLESLMEHCRIKPMVNQVELHPLLSQKELRDFCRENDILVEAYSPLARMDAKLIQHPILMEIGKKYKKTVPQIIIRWNYQNQVVPIVKSSNKERMRSNMDIFDFCLKDEDMESIECINENYRVRHNPDNIDFSKL
ncbi:aldo/keto reductase [Holdemania massiliensis]|uniref:aldo/keto reductase n=1 Tax=Holdemania massiliensis TaxID=1468449 RepID=UPI00356580AA